MSWPTRTEPKLIAHPHQQGTPIDDLTEMLEVWAHRSPDARFVFLEQGERASSTLSYAELDARARAIGAAILQRAVPGDRALLLYPPGVEFIAALFGCFYAGVIAVPVYPPRGTREDPRLLAIAKDANARIALTLSDLFAHREAAFLHSTSLSNNQWVFSDVHQQAAGDFRRHHPDPADIAFLQYTSGSTGTPKGVMLSHSNLVDNLHVIENAFGNFEGDMGLSWLPPYHDMGLIGGILEVLHRGGSTYLMAPVSFVQRPMRWLWAISQLRATITGGPNFAYDLCCEQAAEEDLTGLDLSHWRVAFNGAEPVCAETIERFTATFGPYGFRPEAFLPCYGLAEATLLVTGTPHGEAPRIVRKALADRFSQANLQYAPDREAGADAPPPAVAGASSRGTPAGASSDVPPQAPGSQPAAAEPAAAEPADALPSQRAFVSCGPPGVGVDLRIVDPQTSQEVPPGEVGEIWVCGASVARGYWKRPDETRSSFRAKLANCEASLEANEYFRTGDLGFMEDGELCVTGRIRDLIIVRGRNLYPQDLERAVERCHEAIGAQGVIAFSVDGGATSGEQLVLVAERRRTYRQADYDDICDAIRQVITERFEVPVGVICLIKPATLPRTSSGKVQRRACFAAFQQQQLRELHRWESAVFRKAFPRFSNTDGREDRPAAAPARNGHSATANGNGSHANGTNGATSKKHAHAPGSAAQGTGPCAAESRTAPAVVSSRGSRGQRLAGGAAAPREIPEPASPCGPRSAEAIESWLVDRVATHAELPARQIDPAAPFARYGLDSVTAVKMAMELEQWLGQEIPPTVLYDCPNIRAVATRLGAPAASPPAASPPAPGTAAPGTAAPAPGGAPLHSPNGAASAAPESHTAIQSAAPAAPELDSDAIALVGMAFRFPGASNRDELWNLLRRKQDAIRTVPDERWQQVADSPAANLGGFIDDVDQFAASLFEIAPREAIYIDPQHRLLLEVTWEALEDGGLSADQLRGTDVGVFVGISNSDYSRMWVRSGLPIGTYHGTGNALSMAAHRISYHFDFHGPSLAIDTACSSALAAVHQACRSLRAGDCRVALAGGVNLMLTPDISLAFSEAQMLSPEGRCATFDADADGYVRGEGVGVVCLKRLADAVADRDPILAVIRGSAMNQDGRSNGITAPNGELQTQLIRRTLEEARVSPEAIGYVEAHGTGTSLGDPIEFNALKEALTIADASAADEPPACFVGSIKANLGHLEAASGIAGLVKAVLALHREEIPPQPHLEKLNPLISLAGTRFRIALERQAWKRGPQPRLAGVSSFGFGGTNVHVILEEAPRLPKKSPAPRSGARLLTLSAENETALRQLAQRYRGYFHDHPAGAVNEICFTSNAGRGHHRHRLAVRGETIAQLDAGVAAYLDAQHGGACVQGVVPHGRPPKVAFLFTGQGSQYAQMGRGLYEALPSFRTRLDECERLLIEHFGESLLNVMFAGDAERQDALHATRYAQPALFALEYCLAATLRDWGVEPHVTLGHSIGELAAACVSGCFSLEDGIRLVSQRARLTSRLPRDGAMAAVLAPLSEIEDVLAAFPGSGEIAIAAINGPDNLVLSGDRGRLETLVDMLSQRGYRCRQLAISQAFHSPLTEPVLDEFEQAAATLSYAAPRYQFVSNLTGELLDERLSANYWRRHLRQTVRFAEGLEAVYRQQADVFLEIGPGDTLVKMGQLCATQWNDDPRRDRPLVWVPTLNRGQHDLAALVDAVARLYVCGVPVDWHAFNREFAQQRVSLPHYPFQRERFWIPESAAGGESAGGESGPGVRAAGAAEPPEVVAQQLAPASRRLWRELEGDKYQSLQDTLGTLAAGYFAQAARQLGYQGGSFDQEQLLARGGVLPRYRRLLHRIGQVITQSPPAAPSPELPPGVSSGVSSGVLAGDPRELHQQLLTAYPQHACELGIAQRCGEQLTDVLTGKVDPLQVLFPDGSTADLEQLYQESPIARYYNSLVRDAVLRAASRAEGTFRILEVGAGTGGTTAYLLPQLDPQRTKYTLTDVSPLFTHQLEEKFRDYPFVDYHTLNLEQTPQSQGFGPHYDVVLAANVVHATRDVGESLEHLRRLLVPGGTLVLLEAVRPDCFLDLVFGLTEGWWRFEDTALRPDYPLLDRSQWREQFAAAGFARAAVLPPGDVDSGQAVLLAQTTVAADRPAEPPAALAPKSLQRESTVREAPAVPVPSRGELLGLPDHERTEQLQQFLRLSLAAILAASPEKIDPQRPLRELGIDSLMAIQLKNRVEVDFGVTVSIVSFLEGLTLAQLAERILSELEAEAEQGTAAAAAGGSSAAAGQAQAREPEAGSAPETPEATASAGNTPTGNSLQQIAGLSENEQAAALDDLDESQLDDLLNRLMEEGQPPR